MGATHYNASLQVFPDGDAATSVEWIVDVLPHELRGFLDGTMNQGAVAMKRALE
jgi:hypothetical protein